MTVTELIQALVPFKDDDEITVVIAGWSGRHTLASVEYDCENGEPVNPSKPVLVIHGEGDEMACPHGVVSGQCNDCLAEQLGKEQELLLRVVWHSCSWCRTMNRVTTRWCTDCSHAAQKPRMDCDCPRCKKEA